MKKLKNWHILHVPIFPAKVWVSFSDDFTKAAKEIKIHLPETSHIGITFRKECKNGQEYCIMVSSKDYSIIAHECLHVVNYILFDCGVKLDLENDEIQCYLLSWIISKFKKLKKR